MSRNMRYYLRDVKPALIPVFLIALATCLTNNWSLGIATFCAATALILGLRRMLQPLINP